MASNEPVTQAGPLSMMKPLSPSCFLYEPASAPSSADSKAPKLIAIFSWMAAQDVHIAKYINQHIALYPTSKILLVRSPFSHVFFTGLALREIQPAVSVVKAVADATAESVTEPQIGFHIFSNGGTRNLCRFYDLYMAQSPSRELVLPPHATVFDSCPGDFEWRRAYLALSSPMPKMLRPLVYLMLGWLWWFEGPRFGPFSRVPLFTAVMNTLNLPALLGSELRRTYMYSEADDMIYWKDVEKHARQAEELGFKARTEKFVGSKHCAHARLDVNRYWNLVRETWEGK